jgi:hypothetical protein
MFGLGALLLAASTAVAQSVDPMFNYSPNYVANLAMWGGAVAVTPLTDGWEHLIAGLPANGTTWATQQPGSQVSFRDREGQTVLTATSPGQVVSIVFVGRSLLVTGQVTGFADFDVSNTEHWQVYVDGERVSSSSYTAYNSTSLRGRFIQVGPLPSNAYHNVTLVTGPQFTGSFGMTQTAWTTDMSREK